MFSDTNFTVSIFLAIGIINYISDRTNKNADPISRFTIILAGFGIVSVLMLLNLSPTLVSDQLLPSGQDTNELIQIIQRQKQSLIKLTQFIYGFVILFVFLFLPNLTWVLKRTYRETNPENVTEEKRDWERKRAKGKIHFVLSRGTLWFLFSFAVLSILNWIEMGRSRLLDYGFFDLLLPFGLLYAWGCYIALCQWNALEKWYANILEKQNSEAKEVLS